MNKKEIDDEKDNKIIALENQNQQFVDEIKSFELILADKDQEINLPALCFERPAHPKKRRRAFGKTGRTALENSPRLLGRLCGLQTRWSSTASEPP